MILTLLCIFENILKEYTNVNLKKLDIFNNMVTSELMKWHLYSPFGMILNKKNPKEDMNE